MGLLLPCNVIVYEKNGTTHVSLLNPMMMVDFAGNDALSDMAEDAHRRLTAVFEALQN